MPDTHSRHRTRAIWTALLVTVLWSSSWVLIRVGLDDEALPPLTFAGLRYATAAVVLAGWVGARSGSRRQLLGLRRPLTGRLVALGLVYFAVTQGAQFVAIDTQPAATSSLMLAPTAFFVATLSGRSIGEAVTARQVGGAALVAVGATVYFAIGVIVEGMPDISSRSAAIIGWLAVVNTAVAFTLWNSAQRRLAAVETAAINNTMLVQIAVLAWIFLGESAGPVGVTGIAIVSVGAFLAQAPRRHLPRR
jgi:drug/metabolite transporter (DMT)-like permease